MSSSLLRAQLPSIAWISDRILKLMQCSQCDRLVARSQPLADLIWKRLLPLMTRDDVAEVRPFGFGAEGVWQPLGINDVIRFTRCVFIDVPRHGLTCLATRPEVTFRCTATAPLCSMMRFAGRAHSHESRTRHRHLALQDRTD